MGILKRIFFRKNGTPTLIGKPVSKVLKPRKKQYIGECLLKYNGEPIRKFKVNENAWSTKQAEEKLTKGLTVHVAKVYKNRSKK